MVAAPYECGRRQKKRREKLLFLAGCGVGVEQFRLQLFVVAGCGKERLSGHFAVVGSSDVKGRDDSLDVTIVVVDLLFDIALFIGWIAPSETFAHRKVAV